MSIIGSNILAGASGQAAGGFEIEQSLRFDGAAYLSRTPSTTTNRKTFTWSLWLKRTETGNATQGLICDVSGRFNYRIFPGEADTSNTGSGSTNVFQFHTERSRDVAAWYHIVHRIDTTQSTSANRVRTYINGVEVSQSGWSFPSQNANTDYNWTNTFVIGAQDTTRDYLCGYLAEVYSVDGQSLDPTNFGEYDDNGVWRPIAYTGSYGTNGYYLKFDPSATNGIGHDHSGNGNNFTANGFTTSGTGTDVMSDTPTTNYATLNPLAISTSISVLSEGNLKGVSPAGTYGNVFATIPIPSSGKWYWEVKGTATTHPSYLYTCIGVATFPLDATNIFQASNAVSYYSRDGGKYVDTISSSYGASYDIGDVIGVACDADAGTIEFYKNGTSQGSISHTMVDMVPAVCDGFPTYQATFICNFGQRAFEQTPPTGYLPLNTANLPAPTVKDGSDYFNTVLYSGNSSTQTISGVGFQPDLIFVKARSTAQGPSWYNAISGFNKILMSTTSANGDTTDTGGLNGVTSDGFTLDGNNAALGGTNGSGETYVAWNWLAGNGTTSNTDGSITSTVSANPTAGFSIVSYTGTGANATVGHGLGVAPKMVIIKRRNLAANWAVYHASEGSGKVGLLDYDGAFGTQGNLYWNSTAPSSTVVSIGTSNVVNNLTSTYLAYCFAEVESYSKIGSFVGNGSDDGPFVFCGFRPAYVWLKGSTFVSNWNAYDSARSESNPADDLLRVNSNAAEVSNYLPASIDLLSNGFKIRTSSGDWNSSSQTFVFFAFAENPFGGSGVSPATAR